MKNTISFENRLIKELKEPGIESIDVLMDKVPQFCLNLRFRKIIWEELHVLLSHKRKRP